LTLALNRAFSVEEKERVALSARKAKAAFGHPAAGLLSR
jgi:hypothetical protein